LNSLPTIRFSAAAAGGLESGATALALGGTACSVFVVGTWQSASASFGRLVNFGVSGQPEYNTPTSWSMMRDGTNQNFEIDRVNSLCITSMTYNAPLRMGAIFDGGKVTVYKNNVGGTPAASSGTFLATGKLNVGKYDAGVSHFDGDVSEIIICASALSPSDLAALDAYFFAKWGF
jgi:hypothetical protein